MLEQSTLATFNNRWKRGLSSGYSPEQIKSDLASIQCETHHESDSYYYLVGENDFITPETKQTIGRFIDTSTPVGKKEGEIYRNLYLWVKRRESGLAAWISPPSEGLFPTTKIIFHEITKRGREKLVLNRAILADIGANEIVNIANLFSPLSENPKITYSDPEQVRSRLFTIREEVSTVDLLNLIIDDPLLIEDIKTGRDLTRREEVLRAAEKYSTLIRSGVSTSTLHKLMVNDGFIGKYDISCPPVSGTFSELTTNNADTYGVYKYVERCGNCKVSIHKMIRAGYTCPSCGGEYKGC